MESIYDEYRPRSEKDMCDLFEDLLFMKYKQIIGDQLTEEDAKIGKKMVLSDKEQEKLSKLGIIGRIFRRWFQTNWGFEKFSEYFEGETPKQELSRIYPGIRRGKDYMSVNLEKQDKKWKIKPYFYSEGFLESKGGLFIFALEKLRKNNGKTREPFFDAEFKEFISWLDFGDKAIKKALGDDYFENDFFKYWDLFLRMAPTNIVLNLGIRRLKEDEFSDLSFLIKETLINFFSSQPEGHIDYLSYDQIFNALWETIRLFDKDLFGYDEVMRFTQNEKNIIKFKKDARVRKSIECSHSLGILLDRYVLFPIDRYFNGVELVWTNKEVFLNDLAATIAILKGELKQGDIYVKSKDFLGGLSPFDLRYLWFSPCTVFRLTGSVFKYFH